MASSPVQSAPPASTRPDRRSAGGPWTSSQRRPSRRNQGPGGTPTPAPSSRVPGETRTREDGALGPRVRAGRAQTLLGDRRRLPGETRVSRLRPLQEEGRTPMHPAGSRPAPRSCHPRRSSVQQRGGGLFRPDSSQDRQGTREKVRVPVHLPGHTRRTHRGG